LRKRFGRSSGLRSAMGAIHAVLAVSFPGDQKAVCLNRPLRSTLDASRCCRAR
jgi:hypothetical protein